MDVLSLFKFHPIGQGCFYSGNIRVVTSIERQFNFVYDCGTNSNGQYLTSEINSFKTGLGTASIDMLVISHFDEDHVNGVTDLLAGVHCKRLVIPYYLPEERLILYVATTDIGDDYRDMLLNPINFFGGDRFRIDEIIIVGGPDDVVNEIIPFTGGPSSNNIDSETIERISGNDEELKLNAKTVGFDQDSNPIIASIKDKEPKTTDYSKARLLRSPYRMDILIWEFLFYAKEMNNELLLLQFRKDVETLLGQTGLTIFDLFNNDKIIFLKGLYRKSFGDNLNNTSLSMYHGPLFRTGKDAESQILPYFNLPIIPYCLFYYRDRFGTLLTGDINIKANQNARNFIEYFGAYINEVTFFQVPHHGSVGNWPTRHPSGLEVFRHYIINHGLGRSHHPSMQVVDDIQTNCVPGNIQLNNEVYPFQYHIACRNL